MNAGALRLFDPESWVQEAADFSTAAPVPAEQTPPERPSPELTEDQLGAVRRRRGSLLLSANAGSGKTSVLVERYVASVVEDGLAPSQILAITFTERAAGELRQRIRDRLLALGERAAARELDAGFVLTVHGFCARVLRAHPWAAGLDPAFSVLDERAAYSIGQEAYRRALAALLGDREGPELDLVAAWGPERLGATVAAVHEQLRSRGLRAPVLPPPGPAPSLAQPARALESARQALASELSRCPRPSARVADALRALERCADLLGSQPAEAPPTLSQLGELQLACGNVAALQSPAAVAYDEAWAAYRQATADRRGLETFAFLDRLLRGYGAAYAEGKRARAAVDFDDLELAVRDLLEDQAARTAWAGRFELLMVDEFQDINPRQLEILEALERDNLFCVGDEFQSIYRFRHADVTLFRERRAVLARHGATAELARNFRSRPELLEAINATFAPVFGDSFIALEAARPPSDAADEPRVELMITDTRGWGEHDSPDVGSTLPASPSWRHAEARLVAQRIQELIRSGEAQPGEVAVLVRAASDLAVYERALEERGLATLAAAGRGYWSRQQVQDLTAYLSVVANPLDEGALYGVLASPLAGLSSDGVGEVALAAREQAGGAWAAVGELAAGSPADPDPAGPAGPDPGLSEADLGRLAGLANRLVRDRADAPRLSLAALLTRVLRESGYEQYVLSLRGGRRRLANVHKLLRLAAEFESDHGRDLRAFLAHVAAEERREAREADAPVDGDQLDAVHLMTIHAAKGLEFAVVCVADLGRVPRSSAPWLLVDDVRVGVKVMELGMSDPQETLDYADLREERLAAEEEEEKRILYVAMTRARERLLLSGAADPERWPCDRRGTPPIGWLARALVPDFPQPLSEESPRGDVAHRVGPFEARVRVSLNSPATVGRVLRLEHPVAGQPESAPAGRAGAARAQAGVEPPGEPLQPSPSAAAAVPELATSARPRSPGLSYSALAAYGRCGYRFYVQSILGLPDADPPPGDARPERELELHARARGTLVHALLESLDFARPAPPSTARVRSLARSLGWRPRRTEVEAMIELVAAFAASPLCARLARARRVRREHPFALALGAAAGTSISDEPGEADRDSSTGAGPLLTGVVDVLAEEDEGAVLIVDYKTDRLAGTTSSPEAVVDEQYDVQRAVYALAALRAGAREVEVAHCFLERPEHLASARFAAGDAEYLEARLRALADGLSQGRFPVADDPHRALCLTCPARRSLCSWDETLTLREHRAGAALSN
ncbi:MAG TPA: UvrD-helicase domain-containing protein [Solirubrobacteraceae bacterium]|nr:UvrD-helicase domain-containing protein [Solirubrobacteraceae bacterium]